MKKNPNQEYFDYYCWQGLSDFSGVTVVANFVLNPVFSQI